MPKVQRVINYGRALNEAISQEMSRDRRVFIYGLDVPDHKGIFGSTTGLLGKFGPGRVFGTPLSEDSMTGFALGAAISGLRPIHVHIRVDFLLLGMNQIVNMISNYRYITAGKLKVPLVIRAIIGRGWGQGAQHSKSLQALFAHIPGLKVVMPSTPADAKGLLKSAIRDENPVIFLEHRWLYGIEGEVPEDPDFTLPLGQPRVLLPGKDVTVVATSWMNVEAVKAAAVLKKFHGVKTEVVDPRTLYPLDYGLIFNSVRKTGHLVVADYDWPYCGFSAEVAAQVSEHCFGKLKSPITRIAFAQTPCPTTRPLENLFFPSAVNIIRAVEEKLGLAKADLSGEEFYSYERQFKGPF